MKKVLIGSQAIKHYFPNFRSCNDTDFLVDEDIESNRQIEYYNCNKNPGLALLFDSCDEIPTLKELYTLKVSHSFWDIHWDKTIYDIKFLQENGVSEIDKELFSELYDGWCEIHGPKKAYLSVNNEKFFQDGVDRTIPHDTIHEAVAYYDEPMFRKLKTNKDSAYISGSMFNQLSYDDKIKTCREEIYVVAIERFLLHGAKSTLAAYRNAIKLLVTSMTKGWFPLFIVENIKELFNKDHNVEYYEKFLNNCKEKKWELKNR